MKYPFLELAKVNAPFKAEIEAALLRVARSGRYIGGPEVEELEKEIASLAVTDYAVAVSNGLDALRLIFKALILNGVLKEGDGVIVPANTYIASVLAITDAGLTPVFVDPDERTMNLSGDGVEEALTPEVKAVLTVHLYGRPAIDRRMVKLIKENNLILVEDNAQAIGAVAGCPGLRGTVSTGGLGHAAAFSFYPTKNIGALGDAGAVTTTDWELARTVRALANYGSDTRYHNIYQGYNCRMDPMQAAVLRAKLAGLGPIVLKRNKIASLYNELITNPLVIKPLVGGACIQVWHQYVVRVQNRDRFRAFLLERGIGTDIHYPVPPHKQICYKEYSGLNLPVSESLAAEVVSLPVAEYLEEEDIRFIADAINSFA